MLVRFNERHLKDVFGNIWAAGHPQGMSIQRIAVPADQDRELLSVAR